MKTTSASNRREEVTLTEEAVTRHGLQMTYRLDLIDPRQAKILRISVSCDTEHCAVEVGRDPRRAVALYETVLRGFVTPCTLSDVICDLCCEELE